MKLRKVIDVLEEIAPTQHAQSWDNVGLLVGDPEQDVSTALLTVDYTPEVALEAAEQRCDLVVAYHPPIFEPLKRLTATGPSVVIDAIRRGVAVYSPHTALDIAPGGTNDVLADVIGLTDRRALRLSPAVPTHYKLVTFVPAEHLEKLSRALFDAGAGRIGNYSCCSFRTAGTGTFFGQEGTSPAVGRSGQLEQVDEIRLETVVPITRLDQVIGALRATHPYEEPAFDLNMLAPTPPRLGMGRIGTMPATPRPALFERIKRELEIEHVLVAGPTTGDVTRAAVCAGSCGDLLNDAIAQQAELYLTGEMRHHDALRAANAGITVVCVLHSNSERAALKRLSATLSHRLAGLKVLTSRQDRDPFAVR